MCVIVDSGFGCVSLVVKGALLGLCFICSVTPAHKRFPKDALYEILKDAPSSKWCLCEALIDGVWVVCAVYKYNSKRVLFFCWPKGAAECAPGEPYIASFVDHAGNRAERPVERLSMLSSYFSYSNIVDVRNQQRQDLLDIEYTWVTTNCWFFIFTSLFGMTLVDSYVAMQSGLHEGHPDKDMTIVQFADSVAIEMLENDEDDEAVPLRTRAAVGRPARRSLELPAAASVEPENVHRYGSYGLASDKPNRKGKKNFSVQRVCIECKEAGIKTARGAPGGSHHGLLLRIAMRHTVSVVSRGLLLPWAQLHAKAHRAVW